MGRIVKFEAAGRREALKLAGTVIGAWVGLRLFAQAAAAPAAGWNQAAFEAKDVEEIVKAYGGSGVTPSADITWGSTPEIAENGAVVPINVASQIPDTVGISIVIEKNPNKLAANFHLPEGTQPVVATRVKMNETSKVYAVVQTKGGKFYMATREIKVTLGGCGG